MRLTKLILTIVGILFLSALSIYVITILNESKIDFESELTTDTQITEPEPVIIKSEPQPIEKETPGLEIRDFNIEKNQYFPGDKIKLIFNIYNYAANNTDTLYSYGIIEHIETKKDKILLPSLTFNKIQELWFYDQPLQDKISIFNHIEIPINIKQGDYTITVIIIDKVSGKKTTHSEIITIL